MDAVPDTPSPTSRLADLAARRFPLVARSQVICRPLQTRVDQIRTRADRAAQGGPDALLRAAESLNLAALLVSDCGLPDLARALCWQQFDLFHAAQPLSAATAKLALQPVINLARLRIRAGDGQAAFQLLDDLFTALQSQAPAEIDGRSISFHAFTSSADDQREICAWVWEILLADGMRALARAGQWNQALTRAEYLRGIGQRLWDGRQIAVLAHCFAGQHFAGLNLLQQSDPAEPWEETVSTCLTVLCLQTGGQPTANATQQMVARYLDIDQEPTLVAFSTRLGLTVTDLLDESHSRAAALIHQRLISMATAPGGGYAARDVLAHTTSRARLTDLQLAELTDTVRTAGLDQGTIPAELHARILESVQVSETAATRELTATLRRGTLIFQGWRVTDLTTLAEIGDVPDHETLVEVPRKLARHVPEGRTGMEPLTDDQWAELFAECERSACHLEMRDRYAVGDEAAQFADFLAGRRWDREKEEAERAPWLNLMRETTGRGVTVRRARIVSEPVTDYIRFEHAGTYLNIEAGESVRWLPRHLASGIALPGNDLWLLDGERVLFNLFTGDGDWAGQELTTDPAVVELCRRAFEAVWSAAVPHEDFRLR